MKKSLLAMAVAAALPAFAHAQTNVTLYGIADVAVEYVDFDVDGSGRGNDVRITNGVWSGSRVGLQGSEDLGGGMRGIFNFEHRLDPDTGRQTAAGVTGSAITGEFWQQAYVGLAGGFGEIRLGRDYSVGFRAILPGDMTGYSFYDNSVNLAGRTVRVSNAAQYITPSLGGMRLWTMYGAGEAYAGVPAGGPTSNTRLGDLVAAGLVGNWGPVGGGVYFQDQKLSVGSNQEAGASLGFKFGGFGVGLAYVQIKPEVGEKTKGYYISTSYAMGAGTAFLYARRAEQGDNTNDSIGLAYTYAISKRTVPYFALGYRKNEIAGVESKPFNVALGLRHYF